MGEVKIKMCPHPGGVQRTIPSHLEPKLGHLLEKNAAKRNMSSAVCASSMYTHLCMKMLSFLRVRVWTMPRILLCGITFRV